MRFEALRADLVIHFLKKCRCFENRPVFIAAFYAIGDKAHLLCWQQVGGQ